LLVRGQPISDRAPRALLARIAQLLDGLKPTVREAFLLYQLGGLTHAQVALELGVSSRTVERYVASALLHCYRLCFEIEA